MRRAANMATVVFGGLTVLGVLADVMAIAGAAAVTMFLAALVSAAAAGSEEA